MKNGSSNTGISGRQFTEGDIARKGLRVDLGVQDPVISEICNGCGLKKVVSYHRNRENTSYYEGRRRSMLDSYRRRRNSGDVKEKDQILRSVLKLRLQFHSMG